MSRRLPSTYLILTANERRQTAASSSKKQCEGFLKVVPKVSGCYGHYQSSLR
jgi:hypothetical protein